MSESDHGTQPDSGISRRAVVAGAAWAMPVVAAAVSAPMAVASGGPAVGPGDAPVVVGRCAAATGITFVVTQNGTPVPGESVIVTIPADWSWSDGTPGQTVALTSDADGIVKVPSAQVMSVGGNATVSAQLASGGPIATVTMPVSGTVAREVWRRDSGTQMAIRDMGGVPDGSAAIAWNVFLAPDGGLYVYHRGAGYILLSSGVTSVNAQHYTENPLSGSGSEVDLVTFVAGGVAKTWTSDGAGSQSVVSRGPVPGGTQVVGWNSYLTAAGKLTVSYDTVVAASGVTSATVQHEVNPDGTVNDYVNFVNGTGGHTRRYSGAGLVASSDYTSVPAGSIAVGWNSYLASNGTLYRQNTSVATGVVSARAQHTTVTSTPASQTDEITWVTSSGTGTTQTWGGVVGTTSFSLNYGAGAKVVGSNSFLTADGTLYHGDEQLDSAVVTAHSWRERGIAADLGTAPVADWIAWTAVTNC